jgi:phage terminase small subunit
VKNRRGQKNEHGLTAGDETFATLVASGRTQDEAMAIAHPHTAKWKPTSRYSRASALASLAPVRARIQTLMSKAAKINDATIEGVHEEMRKLSFADARELFELRRCCCRYCYGAGFRYQRTPAEMERDRKAHAPGKSRRKFDEQGGLGWNPNRDPNPKCPECWGNGEVVPYFKDTRKLSESAARLFAGLRTNEKGALEVKLRDQDAALDRMARMVGAYEADNLQNPLAKIVDRIELVALKPLVKEKP